MGVHKCFLFPVKDQDCSILQGLPSTRILGASELRFPEGQLLEGKGFFESAVGTARIKNIISLQSRNTRFSFLPQGFSTATLPTPSTLVCIWFVPRSCLLNSSLSRGLGLLGAGFVPSAPSREESAFVAVYRLGPDSLACSTMREVLQVGDPFGGCPAYENSPAIWGLE